MGALALLVLSLQSLSTSVAATPEQDLAGAATVNSGSVPPPTSVAAPEPPAPKALAEEAEKKEGEARVAAGLPPLELTLFADTYAG